MSNSISILLVGIGGYGNLYIDALFNNRGKENFIIAGVVEPKTENIRRLKEIKEKSIQIYPTIEAFYEKDNADLAIISTPIHYHQKQSCFALSKGSNVLCEKPIAATVQEAISMIKDRDKSKRFLDIGYQWSHLNAIHELKSDIQRGIFGKPIRFKTIILWPRDLKYYNRKWAGKKKDSNGNWILDSIANNATAHYLHNMFYVLGERINTSILPKFVNAELYRVNNIENYDTAFARVETQNGVELIYYASHATREQINPTFYYEFEKAKVMYGEFEGIKKNKIIANFKDGSQKVYDAKGDEMGKIWLALDAIRNKKQILCGPEAAISQTICINGMQESMPLIIDLPAKMIKFDKELNMKWADGLNSIIKECYQNWRLPSESNIPWARLGKKIELSDYKYFKGVGC